MNFLSISYDVDIWVLYSSRGDMLARHGDLNSLLKCAIYFAKESNALLKVFDQYSNIEKIYTHDQYKKMMS